MQCLNFEEAISNIVAVDGRYQYAAYTFVQEALKYTQKMLGRSSSGHAHVGGKELLEGLKGYALESFGPMTITVLAEWGIHSCEDVGEIVFLMIAQKLASKTDQDTQDDFKNGYDFFETFRRPFLPTSAALLKPNASVKA